MNRHEPYKSRNNRRYPRIGIYTGQGTSHSWLWFVAILERMGFYDLSFLSESHLRTDGLDSLDVLAMSGGDTFAIAEGLGPKGADKLEHFIKNGGLYIGSCAGAYLPLYSSKKHLNLFNYVPAKIANLTHTLPVAHHLREKFCTAYGCSFIFHPVREAVRIETNGLRPFTKATSLLAPLYGGPPMIAAPPAHVLATYSGFTANTLFLVDERLARNTVLGKAAVIRQKMGKGYLHLYGPHFEHPHFTVANQLLTDAMSWDLRRESIQMSDVSTNEMDIKGEAYKKMLRDIKREISNSRIVAVGLETLPVRWMIGNKVYETGKIRVFIEAIWSRIRDLERMGRISMLQGQDSMLTQTASEVTSLVRHLRQGINRRRDTHDMAKRVFKELNMACRLFLEIFFRTKMNQVRTENIKMGNHNRSAF